MPTVPLLTPQVQTKVAAVPEPVTGRYPEAAFGESMAKAQTKLGATVENMGNLLGQHLVAMEQRDSEANALRIQTQLQNDLNSVLNNPETDENGTPKGFLNRKLDQAKNASTQFDQQAQQLKAQYLQMPVSPDLKNAMAKTIDAHINAGREQVFRHEASQREASANDALKTFQTASIASAGAVKDPRDLEPLVKTTQENIGSMLKKLGYSDETVSLYSKTLGIEMTKQAVIGSLEQNPKQSQAILAGMKTRLGLNDADVAPIQATIDGKLIHEKQLSAWQTASTFKNADGMINLEKAEKYVYSIPGTAEERAQIFSFVHSMASVNDSIVKEQRQANERAFTNELVLGQAKGLQYQDALFLATKYGRDATDIAEKQNTVTELYTAKTNAFDTWIRKQPEATQAAWSYAEDTIKGKYGNSIGSVPGYATKVKQADAAISELKQDAIGKSPDQIRKLVNERLQDVVIQPRRFWFDKTGEAWKAEAGLRQGLSTAVSQLETDYGVDAVSRARLRLLSAVPPIPATPQNIKAVLDKSLAGEKP